MSVALRLARLRLPRLVRRLGDRPARDKRFSTLQDEDVAALRELVGGDRGLVTDADALVPLNRDWLGKYEGHSTLAVRPRTTEEVSAVLRYCNERRLAVVPQGGNTGLVGGSVPVHDEVILSLARMDTIEAVDAEAGTVVCQAGVVLERLEEAVNQQGLTVPLDLGAKGSCHVGGNVATNAGGVRVLRYGSLHGSVLGVEAVLADGEVVDVLSTLRKDNTGYDLKQLFIGSEGTLGVVTRVALALPPRPKSTQVAWLGVSSYADVVRLFTEAKVHLGEVLSAYEFLDRRSMEVSLAHLGDEEPLAEESPFQVLIETRGSNGAHDREKLEQFLEAMVGAGRVVDGTVAESESDGRRLWRIRESVAASLSSGGAAVYKYDVSLPIGAMYDMVRDCRARLHSHKLDVDVVGYGHVGDGNLHLNVRVPEWSARVQGLLEPWVYEWTRERSGSVSAEHGVGVMKRDALSYSKGPAAVSLMRRLKRLFDPRGILNPYKVVSVVEE